MNTKDNLAANNASANAAAAAAAQGSTTPVHEDSPAAAATAAQTASKDPAVAQVEAPAPTTVVTEIPGADALKAETTTLQPGDDVNAGSTVTGIAPGKPTPNLTETHPSVPVADPGKAPLAGAVTSDPTKIAATTAVDPHPLSVPLPEVGDSVVYLVADNDNPRLKAQGVAAGDKLAATVVRVWGPTSVNLNIIPDGGGAFFKANVIKGTGQGQWQPKL